LKLSTVLKKKITVVLIPGSRDVSKQLSVPLAAIYGSIAAVVLLIMATFYLSSAFFTDRVAESELKQLQSENALLSKKFEDMRWNLAEVESRYAELVQKEIFVRNLFNLPEINLDERQLGVGGPTPPSWSELSEAEKEAFGAELEVDKLLRVSSFELEKFSEVETKLLSVKDRLQHTPSIWPTKGWVSRGYGMKDDPFTGYKQMHRGIDLANYPGTPVIATADGRISSLSSKTKLGKLITLDHGYGFQTRYGHLSKVLVKEGQRVKRGDVIGLMGSSGYSTGSHLHYEIFRNGRALNPHDYILNEM